MATINGLYVFVDSEEVSFNVEATEHPVESGIDITDHVRRKAFTLTISGEIVGKNANSTLSKLKQIHNNGELCKYSGRNAISNCLITSFATGHPNTIWGGCKFSMTLKEVRTATTSYKKTKTTTKTGTQQVNQKSADEWVYHKVKKGDTVWALVAASKAPYKSLSRPAINGKSYSACDWVMAKNQSAFSRKGDFGTLQIGKKLCVGLRKGSTTASGSKKTTTTKKYTVTVECTGSNLYIDTVNVSYYKEGKLCKATIKKLGTFVYSADAGKQFQVYAIPNRKVGKFHFRRFSGGPWAKVSTPIRRVEKLAKNSLVGIHFSKQK